VPEAFASAEAAKAAAVAAAAHAKDLSILARQALKELDEAKALGKPIDASQKAAVQKAIDASRAAKRWAELVRQERFAWERTVLCAGRRRHSRMSRLSSTDDSLIEEMSADVKKATKEAEAASQKAKEAWHKAAQAASLAAKASRELARRASDHSEHELHPDVFESEFLALDAEQHARAVHTEARVEATSSLASAMAWTSAVTAAAVVAVAAIPVAAAVAFRK